MKKIILKTFTKCVALTLFVSFLTVTSCTDTLVPNIEEVESQNAVINNKVSEDEAKTILMNFLSASNRGQTYSTGLSSRQIKGIEALCVGNTNVRTYASDNDINVDIDTLMYVVNFEDGQGFALVAADRRTDPIYAIIDEGSLSVSELDKVDNPGFIIFLEESIRKEIVDIEKNNVNTAVSTYSRPTTSLIARVAPKLSVKWGQRAPYNKHCPVGCPTGCVMTAMAQILSYYQTVGSVQWSYNGIGGSATLNWSRIIADGINNPDYGTLSANNDDSAEEVSQLMRFLGASIGASYSTDGTSADSGDAISWLKTWANLSGTGRNDYNVNNVVSALNSSHKLVWVDAFARYYHVGLVFRKYVDGHAWIIDGYEQFNISGKVSTFVHCNFGWNGTADGFYLNNTFNTESGSSYTEPGINDGGNNIYNLQYKQNMASLDH
jgi:hypothetical protein